jgi:hypothetical protein
MEHKRRDALVIAANSATPARLIDKELLEPTTMPGDLLASAALTPEVPSPF